MRDSRRFAAGLRPAVVGNQPGIARGVLGVAPVPIPTRLAGQRRCAATRPCTPGADDLIERCVPWIDPEPPVVARSDVEAVVRQIDAAGYAEAVFFTSLRRIDDGRWSPRRVPAIRLESSSVDGYAVLGAVSRLEALCAC